MHDISLLDSVIGSAPGVEYDVNIAVLIHYREPYKARVAAFKKYGLLHMSRSRVHVTLIGSAGDGVHQQELLAGWPQNVHVTFLEFASRHPIPKINGYYLWLQATGLRARWHLRVDDDSLTLVDDAVAYLDDRFGRTEVHLMTSPYYYRPNDNQFVPYLRERGVALPAFIHEHESSATSQAAMDRLFASPDLLEMLRKTGRELAAPGDHVLALALQALGVPLAVNSVFSKGFERGQLKIAGGSLLHLHYVDWKDDKFVQCLDAMAFGQPVALDEGVLSELLEHPAQFGRCVGQPLATLCLLPDGRVNGASHLNESRWKWMDGTLCLLRPDRLSTTVFNRRVKNASGSWLFGPYLHGQQSHYLKLSA